MSNPAIRGATQALLVAAFLADTACTPPRPAPPRSPIATVGPTGGAWSDPSTTRAHVAARLSAYFASFVDGSSFEFLGCYWATRAETFGTMNDVSLSEIATESRRFFRDKRAIRFEPDLDSLAIRADGGRTHADVSVRMHWCRAIPAPLPEGYPETRGDWLDCGTEEPMLAYDARVAVTITLDASDRLVAYLERDVLRDRYRVLEPRLEAYAAPPLGGGTAEPSAVLARGTEVVDLGERVVLSVGVKGPAFGRKVRYGGSDLWTRDWAYCSVENPYGGTSVGECRDLELVP